MFYVCMRLNAVSIAINPEIYKNILEGIIFFRPRVSQRKSSSLEEKDSPCTYYMPTSVVVKRVLLPKETA